MLRVKNSSIGYQNQKKPISGRNVFYTNLFPKIIFAFLFFAFTIILAQPIYAQDEYDKPPDDLVPPPLNVVSDEMIEKLDAQSKMKNRAKLAFKLMDFQLSRSEELLNQNDYQESLNELGIFQGLLINTLKYLKSNQTSKGVLKHYKKLEMNLRDFLPRLELLRRNLPYKYGYHVKYLMFYVRDARTRALKPLFDDTVLPEDNNY